VTEADSTVTVKPSAGPATDATHPIRRRFGRRKFDKQPTQPAAVLIASNGVNVPNAAVRQALRLSRGEPVAVMTVARVYGSPYGLPNPGLMPTPREIKQQQKIVTKVVAALENGGVEAWGQVAATRRPAKTMAQAARARRARHVLVVRPEQSARWRQVVEGDLAKDVGRKLGSGVTVEGVSP